MVVLYWSLLACGLLGVAGAPGASLPQSPGCGEKHIAHRFVGPAAGEVHFPWSALIAVRKQTGEVRFSCTGTLINERYIVAAAHCVKIPGGWSVHRVHLGEFNRSSDRSGCEEEECTETGIQRSIANVTVHSGFRGRPGKFLHDIALIRLASDITFSDSVLPICLPQADATVGGTNVLSESVRANRGSLSGKETFWPVEVISVEDCASFYSKFGVDIQPTQLCVLTHKRDECMEELNGTLMQKTGSSWELVGIYSFGRICGSHRPQVYTNVAEYIDWIRDNVNDNEEDLPLS